jgi:hypothetical protein
MESTGFEEPYSSPQRIEGILRQLIFNHLSPLLYLNITFRISKSATLSVEFDPKTSRKMKASITLLVTTWLAAANAMVPRSGALTRDTDSSVGNAVFARQATSATLPPAADTLQSADPNFSCDNVQCALHVSILSTFVQ